MGSLDCWCKLGRDGLPHDEIGGRVLIFWKFLLLLCTEIYICYFHESNVFIDTGIMIEILQYLIGIFTYGYDYSYIVLHGTRHSEKQVFI